MRTSPNQALQRTGSAVTAPAALHRRLSTHRQVPRPLRLSLSLGSFGQETKTPMMNAARSLFILAAIPFTLLAPFMLFMEQAWRTGRGSSGPMVFAVCGGAYIYGSIFALRGQLPLSSLVLVGIILNILGACVWVPAFQFSDGTFTGLVGVGLTLAWLLTIVREYRDERH